MREYQKRQLPIVLAPVTFTLLAIAADTWMPGNQLTTWGVVAGMVWMAIGWLVFQVGVSRHKREG